MSPLNATYPNVIYRGAVAASVNSAFGRGHWRSDDVLISNVRCTGHESNLLDCPYTVDDSCSGSDAASVVCMTNLGNTLEYMYTFQQIASGWAIVEKMNLSHWFISI